MNVCHFCGKFNVVVISSVGCKGDIIFNSVAEKEVMAAARAAGAGGGTVVHSRSVVDDSALPHVGTGLAEEKDIVLIVANSETKLAIMQAISEKCGIRSEAKGIVYALPIDNVIGLSD